MYKAEWRKGYGQLGNIDSSSLAVGYKRGRLLGREKRRRRRRKKGVKPPVGRKEKAGSYHASISEIDFPVRQCLVSLLVSFLFSAHPIPPSSFYRRQTLSAAADENSASLRTHSLRSPPTTAMRYHDSRYLHRMLAASF